VRRFEQELARTDSRRGPSRPRGRAPEAEALGRAQARSSPIIEAGCRPNHGARSGASARSGRARSCAIIADERAEAESSGREDAEARVQRNRARSPSPRPPPAEADGRAAAAALAAAEPKRRNSRMAARQAGSIDAEVTPCAHRD